MEKVALLYGGRSSEHEISVITALQAIQALDPLRYEIVPVYLALNGKWYTGMPLLERTFYWQFSERVKELDEVTLLPDPTIGGFLKRQSQKILPIDLCLLAFHGQYGEDGCVQGLLELADLPYTGSRVLGASLAMSKSHAKAVLKAHDFPVLPWITIHKNEAVRSLAEVRKKIINALSFPLFIKPNHLGSSIAISSATDAPSLDRALAQVFQYDEVAIIEPFLKDFIELNVAVLDGDPLLASLVEMPIATSEGVLSYEDKYLRGGGKSGEYHNRSQTLNFDSQETKQIEALRSDRRNPSPSGKGEEEDHFGEVAVSQNPKFVTDCGISQGMAGLTRVIDPKEINSAIKSEVITKAKEAFQHLNCSGVCRFDFLFDLKKQTLIFNEVNTIPGSLSFYLWDQKKPPLLYTELLNRLLDRAKQVKATQRSLKKEFGFYALKKA